MRGREIRAGEPFPCFAEARQVLSHGEEGPADGFVDQVGKPETRDAADFLQRGAALLVPSVSYAPLQGRDDALRSVTLDRQHERKVEAAAVRCIQRLQVFVLERRAG